MSNRKLYQVLSKQKKTIAFAESMTGGGMAASLVLVPNASAVLAQSYICYSIESKEKILGVSPYFIEKYGEVSAKVAEAMNEGLKEITKADVYVSITGNAGPTYKSSFSNRPKVAYVYIESKDFRKVIEIVLNSRSRKRNINKAIFETFDNITDLLESH